MKTVGEAIQYFRTNHKNKISQKKLGLVIRDKETAAQSIIRYFEIGRVKPKEEELKKLQDYLGVTPEEFEEYMTRQDPLLIFHGVPLDEKIFDIWPEGIQLIEVYQKVSLLGDEKLIINVLEGMADSLKRQTNEYKRQRLENETLENPTLLANNSPTRNS